MRKRPTSGLSFIEPMLPTLVDDPPEGGEWTHEVKFDGYRIIANSVLQLGVLLHRPPVSKPIARSFLPDGTIADGGASPDRSQPVQTAAVS